MKGKESLVLYIINGLWHLSNWLFNRLTKIQRKESIPEPAFTHEEFLINKKNEAVLWAKEVLDNSDKYVILDSETTGLGTNDVVIELAIIDLNGNVLFNSRFKPKVRKRMSTEASEIHGIKMRDLENSLHFSDVVDEIKLILANKRVLIYNADFDDRILSQTSSQDECAFLRYQSECVMMKYSQYVGSWNNYYNEFRYQKLRGGDHTALGDCLATLKTIEKMASNKK